MLSAAMRLAQLSGKSITRGQPGSLVGFFTRTRLSEVCASAVSAPSTWAEVPGGAGRWTLSDVDTGLNSMADMYTAADSMATQITLFTTLQGITMQLLILRLIRVLSAQKRLSILTTTAVKVDWHCDLSFTLPLQLSL